MWFFSFPQFVCSLSLMSGSTQGTEGAVGRAEGLMRRRGPDPGAEEAVKVKGPVVRMHRPGELRVRTVPPAVMESAGEGSVSIAVKPLGLLSQNIPDVQIPPVFSTWTLALPR